jgi:hypothetical protein
MDMVMVRVRVMDRVMVRVRVRASHNYNRVFAPIMKHVYGMVIVPWLIVLYLS